MTQAEINALRSDIRFHDKYRNLEMDCPDQTRTLCICGDDLINDAVFERCILP